MAYKNDLFEVLGKLSKRDLKYFEGLDEEQLKELQPLVLMRWMSGTKSAGQVYFLNEFVNPYVFPLSKHKTLLLQLLMVSSMNGGRLSWLKMAKKQSKFPLSIQALKQYNHYNTSDAEDVLPLYTNEQILELAELCGFQDDDIKSLKKELKQRK